MASLMENLISILDEEGSRYEELLELSMKKTPTIVAGNLEELQKITDEEQVVVSKISRLEAKRTETTQDIANVLNRDVKTLKLSNIIEMLSGRPQEQKLLAAAHDKLQSAVHRMQQINDQNKELIAHALEMVEFDMTLIQAMKTAPETANYDRGAHSAGDVMGLDRNGFDAKQ